MSIGEFLIAGAIVTLALFVLSLVLPILAFIILECPWALGLLGIGILIWVVKKYGIKI